MKELGDHNASFRVVAIFPIFIGGIMLGYGDKHNSYILIVSGLLMLFGGLWLLRSKLIFYFDKSNSNIIKKKQWLWFESIEDIEVAAFSHITLGAVSTTHNAGSYFVELSIPEERGFSMGALKSIRLKTFSKRKSCAKESAKAYAEELAELLDMNVITKDGI